MADGQWILNHLFYSVFFIVIRVRILEILHLLEYTKSSSQTYIYNEYSKKSIFFRNFCILLLTSDQRPILFVLGS